ncbi:MAG: phosphate acyltransferase [Candidatus Marinimicrobia bacterium]|nr:phosphate acyltransferase [Candidatus Neomarinimicrobiota bacterium]
MHYEDIYKRINVKDPKTVNVVFPNSYSNFEALAEATKKGFIIPRLYGKKGTMEAYAKKAGLDTGVFIEAESAEDAIWAAISDIRNGIGDALMKADISTASFLSPILNRDKGLRKGDVLSHIAVCDSPGYHKLLFLTDGALNIELGLDKKRAITDNAIELAEKILQRKPKVAFAAVVEKLNPKLPETLEARTLAEEYTAKGYEAEGPIALDVILNAEAAKKKKIDSKISGDVDVILFPDITTCNFMLKSIIELQRAPVGGLVMGAKVPLILLSRSDRASEKLNSIALSLIE